MDDETDPPSEQRRDIFILKSSIISSTLVVLAAIAFPNLMEARKHGNEASAIGALKTIGTSEARFREGDNVRNGEFVYGMLSELVKTGVLDLEIGSGTKQGYLFQATYSFLTSEFLWFAVANPVVPGWTGDRSFDTNQAGVIFYTTARSIALDTNTCVLPNDGNNGDWHGSK